MKTYACFDSPFSEGTPDLVPLYVIEADHRSFRVIHSKQGVGLTPPLYRHKTQAQIHRLVKMGWNHVDKRRDLAAWVETLIILPPDSQWFDGVTFHRVRYLGKIDRRKRPLKQV